MKEINELLGTKRMIIALIIVLILLSPMLWAQVPPPQVIYYPQQNVGWGQPQSRVIYVQKPKKTQAEKDSLNALKKFSLSIDLGYGFDYKPEYGFLQEGLTYGFYQADIIWHTGIPICLGAGVSSPHEVWYKKQTTKMTPFYIIAGVEVPRGQKVINTVIAHTGLGIKFGGCATGLEGTDPTAPMFFSTYLNFQVNVSPEDAGTRVGIWVRPELADYNFFGKDDNEYLVSPDHWQVSLAFGLSVDFGKKK